MLSPFRIKSLLDPALEPGDGSRLYVDAGPGAIVHFRRPDGTLFPYPQPDSLDGIVQVSHDEYDQTLSADPDAALSYVDVDDGENITVSAYEYGRIVLV